MQYIEVNLTYREIHSHLIQSIYNDYGLTLKDLCAVENKCSSSGRDRHMSCGILEKRRVSLVYCSVIHIVMICVHFTWYSLYRTNIYKTWVYTNDVILRNCIQSLSQNPDRLFNEYSLWFLLQCMFCQWCVNFVFDMKIYSNIFIFGLV